MVWAILLAVLQIGPSWSYVLPGHWTVFMVADDDQTLVLAQPGDTALPRMWFRSEYKEGVNPEGVRSGRGLMEADCEGRRVRFLESHTFLRPNLLGESVREHPSQDWSYPAPQTFAAMQLQLICQRAVQTPGR